MSSLICILCRKTNRYTNNLSQNLTTNNIENKIIEDDPFIEYKYNGLCHTKKNSKSRYKSTAWDNAFKQISKYYIDKFDYFYFIEDDVYSKNLQTFVDLINYYNNKPADLLSSEIKSKQNSTDWYWWSKDLTYRVFKYPHKSLNCICRISNVLMCHLFDYFKKRNQFFYNEFFFASVCAEYNMPMQNFNYKYIKEIRYRPIFQIKDILDSKIYHPVKEFV